MVIKSPKNKGSAGEREVILLLTTWATQVGVALHLERNLEQTRYGGADINGLPGFEVEVKREQSHNLAAWWRQVTVASERTGKRPLLCHRKNNCKWSFRTWVYVVEYTTDGEGLLVPLIVDLDLAQGEAWFKACIKQIAAN